MLVKITTSCLFATTICIVFCATSCAGVDDDQQLVVETSTATFRGKRIEVHPHQLPDVHDSVAAYTGIPYAEPPVDELRFKRPVPNVVEGDFDATRDSTACMQAPFPALGMTFHTSEDCLFLDIFVPEPKPTSAAVMVWIHGGGFTFGAGSMPQALPIPLSAMNDVIVVTLNYRLGVFGFLATGDDEIPANLGLLDQRQALVWVQENIAAFGGDPTQVTIFGESAGSISINFHVLSPMSAGLFSGAIMESGATTPAAYMTSDHGSEVAFSLGEVMNCSASTTKELATCLKGKPAEDLINIFIENPILAMTITTCPVIDGLFIPKNPLEMANEGDFNRVDMMIGILADEGNVFNIFLGGESHEKPTWNKTTMQMSVAMNMMHYRDGVDQLVLETVTLVYAPEEALTDPDANFYDAFAQFMGDNIFLCPSIAMAEQLSAGESPVYHYIMTHVPSTSIWGEETTWMGATHGEDMPYVFGVPFMVAVDDTENSITTVRFTDEEVELSLQMMKYWSNFAKTGDPNLSTKEESQAVDSTYPAWPRFTKEEQNYKDLSLSFENRVGHPCPKRCHFQLELLPKLQANAAEKARLKSMLEEKVNADSEKSCEDRDSCPEE